MATQKERAEIELVINNKVAKSSLKELRLELIEESRILDKMKKDDDPAGWTKQAKKVGIMRQAVSQANAEINAAAGSLKKLSIGWEDIAGGLVGGDIAMQAIDKLMQSIPALINRGGELSDMWADVQKETGLTSDSMQQLDKDLRAINTRTPIEKLYELAEIAGKLGYESTADVLTFVKAANMLDVALSKSLGGNTEEAINDIGKLVEIYGLVDELGIEQSMLKVGSAINTVGASSAANEGYLVAWSKRFAGIAPNAGISIADTLGMAAAADILGQSSELSATNIGKMIIALGKDVPYFAKVAGMSVKTFSDLLKTDGNEAFLRVLEGARSTTKGVEGLTKTLETLGIEGSEGAQVLGALTKNIDLVREQQDIANRSFTEGTSVLNEYNIKNQNNAAILAKIGKVMSDWWDRAAASMGPVIQLMGKFFGVVNELDVKMGEFAATQQKVIKAEGSLPALIKRYEDLQLNTNKSAQEQKDLHKIMQEIATVVPEAAYEFDQYGNVLGIDIQLTKDYIVELRRMLDLKRKSAVEDLDERKLKLSQRAEDIRATLNRGTIKEVSSYTGEVAYRKARAEDINQLRSDLAQIQKLQGEVYKKERELFGDKPSGNAPGRNALASAYLNKPRADKNTGGGGSGLTGPGGKDAAKKAAADAKALNDELLRNQQQLTLGMMKEQEKELLAAQYKYDTLQQKAKGNAQALKTIEEQRAQEVGAINDKYSKKYLADFYKTIRGQLDVQNEASKAMNEFTQANQDKADELAGDEFSKLDRKYRAELAMAEANGYDKLDIHANYATELNRLMQEQGAKEIAATQKVVDAEVKAREEAQEKKRKAYEDEMKYIDAVGQVATSANRAISDVLSLAAKNQEQNAEFQKAVAIFQIAIDTAMAISAAIAAAAAGDPYTTAIRIAAAVASVTGAIVKVKALMSEAQEPKAPAFRADGGPTDLSSIRQDTSGNPQGWVTQPTLFNLGRRSYVAGEAGAEYVISNPMLRNPAVADFVGSLEAMRQNRFFADGGSTAMTNSPRQQQMTDMREVERLLRMIASKPDGWNYSAFEDYKNGVDNVRNRATA